jgi:hypothetical protein
VAIYSADKNIGPANWSNKIKLVSHTGNIAAALNGLGWNWVLEDECSNYLPGEAVVLPQPQADDLLRAADELYEMMVGAVPDDLPDDFLHQLAILER